MRTHFQQLSALGRKKTRLIIGLMSGTSLDGLDVALCRFTGSGTDTKVKLLHFSTEPYTIEFQASIREVFAKQTIDFQALTLLNVKIAEVHASLILSCLERWKIPAHKVDLIASHGQTVFHAPRSLHQLAHEPNATLQIGDPDIIAMRTGIITIADFRQKHIAAGGEGAPLALYGDFFVYAKPGEDRILLNIGGIANFTFLPADGDTQKAFATDTGPGNTLLDEMARQHFSQDCDKDSVLANNGRVDERLLDIFKSHPYFAQQNPKTTGPEMFGSTYVNEAVRKLPKGNINPYDLMATLSQLTADTIADAVTQLPFTPGAPRCIYVSGGGAHNPMIMSILKEKLPNYSIQPFQSVGLSGDAKEAVLFALLANETVAGDIEPGQYLGGVPLVGMGKVCLPG